MSSTKKSEYTVEPLIVGNWNTEQIRLIEEAEDNGDFDGDDEPDIAAWDTLVKNVTAARSEEPSGSGRTPMASSRQDESRV